MHHMLVWTELFQTAGCFEIVVLQRSLQKHAIKNAFMQRWFKGFREPKLSVACALRAMQIKLGRTVARWTTSKVRELHATEAKARVWRWQHKSMNCALYNKKQRRCYDSQHTQCAYIDVHGELCETLPVHYFQANITKLCAICKLYCISHRYTKCDATCCDKPRSQSLRMHIATTLR